MIVPYTIQYEIIFTCDQKLIFNYTVHGTHTKKTKNIYKEETKNKNMSVSEWRIAFTDTVLLS